MGRLIYKIISLAIMSHGRLPQITAARVPLDRRYDSGDLAGCARSRIDAAATPFRTDTCWFRHIRPGRRVARRCVRPGDVAVSGQSHCLAATGSGVLAVLRPRNGSIAALIQLIPRVFAAGPARIITRHLRNRSARLDACSAEPAAHAACPTVALPVGRRQYCRPGPPP